MHEYGVELIKPEHGKYDAIILAVAHDEFKQMSAENIRKFGKANNVMFDLKYLFDAVESDLRL